jgi:DNA-directed RNA polymerase specialized sigma subunit
MTSSIDRKKRQKPRVLVVGPSCTVTQLLTCTIVSLSSEPINIELPTNNQITPSFLKRLNIETDRDDINCNLAIYITSQRSNRTVLEAIKKRSKLTIVVSKSTPNTKTEGVGYFSYSILENWECVEGYKQELELIIDRIKYDGLTQRQIKIMEMKRKQGIKTSAEIEEGLGVSPSTVDRALRAYKENCRKNFGTILYHK